DSDLGRGHRIPRKSDQGRPLEQGPDGGDVRAIKSDLGEAVLRNLHRGARMLHLPTQILHLGNGEARIMSNDDDVRDLEGRVERRDELLLARSIHWILSRRRPSPLRGEESAWLHQPPPPCLKRGRDDVSMPCPRMRQSRRRYRLEPMRGDPEPVSPVYAGPAGSSAEFASRLQRRAMPPSCGPDLIALRRHDGGELSRWFRHLQSWTGLGQD